MMNYGKYEEYSGWKQTATVAGGHQMLVSNPEE